MKIFMQESNINTYFSNVRIVPRLMVKLQRMSRISDTIVVLSYGGWQMNKCLFQDDLKFKTKCAI